MYDASEFCVRCLSLQDIWGSFFKMSSCDKAFLGFPLSDTSSVILCVSCLVFLIPSFTRMSYALHFCQIVTHRTQILSERNGLSGWMANPSFHYLMPQRDHFSFFDLDENDVNFIVSFVSNSHSRGWVQQFQEWVLLRRLFDATGFLGIWHISWEYYCKCTSLQFQASSGDGILKCPGQLVSQI